MVKSRRLTMWAMLAPDDQGVSLLEWTVKLARRLAVRRDGVSKKEGGWPLCDTSVTTASRSWLEQWCRSFRGWRWESAPRSETPKWMFERELTIFRFKNVCLTFWFCLSAAKNYCMTWHKSVSMCLSLLSSVTEIRECAWQRFYSDASETPSAYHRSLFGLIGANLNIDFTVQRIPKRCSINAVEGEQSSELFSPSFVWAGRETGRVWVWDWDGAL